MMMFRNTIVLILLLSVSGCYYNIAPQKKFDFSATYYMDGTCEIVLPNRHGMYVHSGKFYSEFSKGRGYSKITYSLVCSNNVGMGSLGNVKFNVGINVRNEQPILLIDENHMELPHTVPPVPERFRAPLPAKVHDYRFIQFENDVVLDGRQGTSQLGLNNYFQFVSGRPANFLLSFGFRIVWSGKNPYSKQLPGFTHLPCPSYFTSREIIFRINGITKAEETGIYAEIEGEDGEIVSSNCK